MAKGFLDLTLTLSAKKKLARIPNEGFSFLFHWESAITGCTLTADRLAAAGLVDSAQCRFCDTTKESLPHFADECPKLPPELARPSTQYYFGPNFALLGIAELSMDTIREKLVTSKTSDLPVTQWVQPIGPVEHVWTDGSVQLNNHPWLALASFAVISQHGTLLAADRVRHWRLASYTAELWAVLFAFAMSTTPLVIHTDSLAIVSQFSELLLADKVQLEWTHANWWGFLLNLVHQRRNLHASPLQLLWCPAHLLEHIPSPMITDEAATRAGSSKQDIVLNRLADHFAKQQIQDTARAIKNDLVCKEVDVLARQLWLAQCNRLCKKPAELRNTVSAGSPELEVQYSARQMFPRWPWDVPSEQYLWQAQIQLDMPFRESNKLSDANFRIFLKFCATVKWRIGDTFACSVFELAIRAFVDGWRFQLPSGTLCTPQAFASIIRAGFAACKQKQIIVAPLLLEKGNKSNGKTFPKGTFVGAEAFMPCAALDTLARAFQKGASLTPHSWCLPFDSLL